MVSQRSPSCKNPVYPSVSQNGTCGLPRELNVSCVLRNCPITRTAPEDNKYKVRRLEWDFIFSASQALKSNTSNMVFHGVSAHGSNHPQSPSSTTPTVDTICRDIQTIPAGTVSMQTSCLIATCS